MAHAVRAAGLSLLLSVLAAPAVAQTLLRDFNTTPSTEVVHSSPSGFLPIAGGRSLFHAYSPATGRELWTTDGTAAGTTLLKDIVPGATGSEPRQFVELSSGVYLFTAETPKQGWELWRTDGTLAGTQLVRDIRLGPQSSVAAGLVKISPSQIAFLANDGVHGIEPWITDGTKHGTHMVRDVVPGPGGMSNGSAELAPIGGGEYVFSAIIQFNSELWASDGTAAGTRRVFDFQVSSTFGPSGLMSIGNRAVFEARVGGGLDSIWSTDGRTAGTFSLGVSGFPYMQRVGATSYFRGAVAGGYDLWKTDGTLAGTSLVVSLVPGDDNPWMIGGLGSNMFFVANGPGGRQLYRTDGTAANTVAISNAVPAGTFYGTNWGEVVQGELYYRASVGGPIALYRTDGTAAGTVLATPFATTDLGVAGSTIVLGADDGTQAGFELFTTDGTPAGTQQLVELAPQPVSESSHPQILGSFQGRVVFRVDDGVHGSEPWITDGTVAGTELLVDLAPGPTSSGVAAMVAGETRMMLIAGVPGVDGEPWFSDGTAAGTYQLDVYPASDNTQAVRAGRFGVSGDRFLFSAVRNAFGEEPYVTDGTVLGTSFLGDLTPGTSSSVPYNWTAVGDRTIFICNGTTTPFWTTDGTPSGTVPLAPQASWVPTYGWSPTSFQGRTWFAASDVLHGSELWSTDGTPAGTQLALDLLPGPAGSGPFGITRLDGRLIMRANVNGQYPVVVSDGTASGTNPLTLPGQLGSSPVSIDGHRALMLIQGGGGADNQLWSTDGTVAGTGFVRPIRYNSSLIEVANVGRDRVLAALDGGVAGQELWASDGTGPGTFRVFDLAPGDSFPRDMVRAGQHVIFTADDGVHGFELFSVPLTQTDDWAVEVYGSGCPGTGGVSPQIALDGVARAASPQPWSLTLADALPNSFAAFAWSTERAAVPLPGGCHLWLGGQPVLMVLPTNTSGEASLAIAPTASLLGAHFATQWFVLDANGAALGFLSSTPGLEFVVGP